MQFILVAIFAYPSQAAAPPFLLKRTSIPIHALATSAAMFYTVNMLNNWAFAFDISVPVHIILRSFGSVTTMAAGYLKGKKYSPLQVVSVLVLTGGVIISAWADAEAKVFVFKIIASLADSIRASPWIPKSTSKAPRLSLVWWFC
jgi:drug/metabolite transporter (DMT)-like permease